ncbi:MAG TPA: hypothetical protein VEI52_13790 [Terriglobales bacterium]|nr:hypothetical protein [Terriglobales bacterium]
MKIGTIATQAVLLSALSGLGHADFQYSQQSKMTGGALLQMTQTLGKFSKNMRQANEPQTSTTMVKGNRMRKEHSNGTVEIIDLDGRRFINIDSTKKQYSIMTFDDFKAAMQRAQEQAKQAQQQQMAKNPQAQNVKITPKFDAQVTGATRDILGVTANETKMKMEMEIQGTDPQTQQTQSGSYVVTSDAWMAPSVPGYDEVRDFQVKLAKELDWLPGTMGGMMGMNMGNPQMGSAMEEFRKNAATLKGMPMAETVSMGMAGSAQQDQNPPSKPPENPPPEPTQNTSVPTSPSAAIGQVFGGWKKKKQQDQQQQPSSQNTSAPPGQPGALLEMTMEVTSFSKASLDSGLFDVPAGYTLVQRNPDEALGGKQAPQQ